MNDIENMKEQKPSIRISEEIKSRLAKLGTVDQTYEDVILMLLEEHEKQEREKA